MPPEPCESLMSLICRNAGYYRFRNPQVLLRRIKPPTEVLWTLCEADPAEEFGTNLRNLLNIDCEDTFRDLSPWTGSPVSYSVMGHAVWRELVQPGDRAVCPLCLKDSIHHRALWSVSAMPVCAVHGVWLRRRCQTCEAPLSWYNSALHLCSNAPQCRADLRKAPVERAPASAMPAMVTLHQLAHDASPIAGPLGMGFGQALTVSFLLGRIIHGFERWSRPPGFIMRQREQLPDLVASGWDALDDWPNGFHRMLDGLRERASERAGKDGLRKAFGTLSTKVHQWAREPWGAPVGFAFAQYAASQGNLATTARTLKRYAPGAELRHMFITMSEAQQALGISASTIGKLARRRDLYVLPPRGAGIPALMRADTFRQLEDEFKDFLLPEQTRLALGIGRKVMVQIEDAGLIQRLAPETLVLESKPFRRSDIDAFVKGCMRLAPKLTKQEAKNRKLTTIVSSTAPGRTVPDICRALLDGRLRAAGYVPENKGLTQVRLVLADVERALPSSKETLSMVDAAKQVGLDYGLLHHWAKHGLLETTRSDGVDERGLRVTHETWMRFLAEYATGSMIAEEMGQGTNHWISRHLMFLGIVPVSGGDVDGGATPLFRRSDLGPKVMKAVRRLQAGTPGTPQDKHRRSFARAALAAAAVAQDWGVSALTRSHNLFVDTATGRAVQVVSGRRPDLTGVFVFHVHSKALAALQKHRDPWVALVPNEGDQFLMTPAARVPWRGDQEADIKTRYVTARFNGRGEPLEMAEWSRALPKVEPSRARPVAKKAVRRSFNQVVQAAEVVARSWATTLDRKGSRFTDTVGGRVLQVISGRPCQSPTMQIFPLVRESYERLSGAAEPWVALVPKGGSAFVLVPWRHVQWRGQDGGHRHAKLRVDALGTPMGTDGTMGAHVFPL